MAQLLSHVKEITFGVVIIVLGAFIVREGIFADPQKVIIIETPEIPENSLIFSENFEDQKTQLLIPNNGGLRNLVNDGAGNTVYEIDNSQNNAYADVTFGSNSWVDYAIQFQINLVKVDGIASIVHFRESSDHENGYILGLMQDEQAVVVAYKQKMSGDWVRLNTTKFIFEEGHWYDVYVYVVDTTIKVYLDNFLLADIENDLLRNGAISMSTGPGNVIQIDNINVYSYD